ncbi:hypothetical protein MLD38_018029 [Melastoma candidum]|uniref:Uncharacterized protein n=1 Tax=Melastoma candidum TaxID=119954 RepID=A0ACB9QW24_9MYRT|nr:hypothetical protein MLD38_018029 [Melastoma candidum]
MDQLVNFIIRPPRAEYNPKYDLLDQEFVLKGKLYRRKDLEITNSRGDVLQCSHYVPTVTPQGKPLPCVIYCHGNSGCRADASEAAIVLLPSNITVFTLDFSGSGISGGEHVTLGWNEKDDLKAVVEHLRGDGNVSMIGLWGRSMGAVTSLMYGAEDPSIAGLVLDSPFSDLVELMMELADTHSFRLPKFTVKIAIQYMRRAIQKKAKFDIVDLNAIKVAQSCFVPVLFGHATDDDFIRPHHSDRIFEAYMGDKNMIKFEGDHNSPRPQFYFDSINIFFHNVLQPPEDEVPASLFNPMQDYFSKGDWRKHEAGSSHGTVPGTEELADSSTADAIRELRTRRLMSRMELPSDVPPVDEQNSSLKHTEGDQDPPTSSSKMINFELSNGYPYGPPVPATIEDDQYVEYQLDDLTGYPCSSEEEEKMLMAAVMESLKDLELKHSDASSDLLLDTSSDSICSSSQKDDREASSTTEDSQPSKTDSSLTSTSAPPSDLKTPDESPPSDKSPPTVSVEDQVASPPANPPDPTQSQSSGTDVSGNTKATLTVVRNPSSNIMDGLLRRWDLNFFKNNR